MAGMRIVETTKKRETVAAKPRTVGRSEFQSIPQPEWFTYETNAEGEMIDANGAVTKDTAKAAKRWRTTRFPDPKPGEDPRIYAVMLHPEKSPRGLAQLTIMGETFPRFLDPPDPSNPRNRQARVKMLAMTASQKDALLARAATEHIEADSEWEVDEETQKLVETRKGGPICKADLLVIEEVPEHVGMELAPTETTIHMLRQWRERMGDGPSPDLPQAVTPKQQQDAVASLLYSMQIADPNDRRTPEEILRDLVARAQRGEPVKPEDDGENAGPVDNGTRKPKKH